MIGNNSNGKIQITYSILLEDNPERFTKKPIGFKLNDNLKNVYKRNKKAKPEEISVDFSYDSKINKVTINLNPNEAVAIGFLYSFDSKEHEFEKRNLKIHLSKEEEKGAKIPNKNFKHLNRFVSIMEIIE